jgi:hypothetical protein
VFIRGCDFLAVREEFKDNRISKSLINAARASVLGTS